MRKSMIALSVLAALPALYSGAALAEEPAASPHTFTGNVGFVSEYRYRGIAQTEKKAALQGGFDYSHESGFYLGTWASNVSWFDAINSSSSNSLEWDFYGGYKVPVGPVTLDVGLLQYYYPGADVSAAGVPSPNTLEGYVGVTWEFLTFKYSRSFTNLFGTPDSKGSQYYDLSASYDVWNGFIVGAHFGRQNVAHNSVASYNDWKIGVTKEVLGVNVGLSYIGTDSDSGFYKVGGQNWASDSWVLSVNKTF
ncbi:MAG: hypothetical protein JNJ44_06575 [Zoogloeaceae bacterium]|nr:hypothetical protein [Zoogloeaceae bacterium]